MNKMNVMVVFGGVSSEHPISCISAASILRNIDKEKYTIYPVGITRDGAWRLIESEDFDSIEHDTWEQNDKTVPAVLSPDRKTHGLIVMRETGTEIIHVDCVFPVMHGIGGEDGTIQGLLEMAHIPYVGPGVAASACSMDKSLTKVVVEQEGVRQAAFYLARRHAFAKDAEAECAQAEQKLGSYPVFVKPCSEGSSVGVSKATDRASLKAGLAEAFKYDSKVLVEEFIDGHEIEVAVLGNEEPTATFAGEIAPRRHIRSVYSGAHQRKGHADGTRGRCARVPRAGLQGSVPRRFLLHLCRGRNRIQRDQHDSGLHEHQHVSEAAGAHGSCLCRSH